MNTIKTLLAFSYVFMLLLLPSRAAIQYWDPDTGVGYQHGDGSWSTNGSDANWGVSATGPRSSWTNGNDAYFPAVGGSSTVILSTPITANQLRMDGSIYTVVVTNGGSATFTNIGTSYIGNGSSSNTLLVVGGNGVTSVLQHTAGGSTLGVGAAGYRQNALVIDGAGFADSALVACSNFWVKGSASLLSVTNGGRFVGKGAFSLYGTNSQAVVSGAGSTLTNAGAVTLGLQGSDNGNIVTVQDGGSLACGSIVFGSAGGLSNQVTVSGGAGVVSTLSSAGAITLGSSGGGAVGSNHVVLVDGRGAVDSALVTASSISIGNQAKDSGDSVTVLDGGRVTLATNMIVGNGAGANNNSLTVNNARFTCGANLTLSVSACTNSSVIITNGGVMISLPAATSLSVGGNTAGSFSSFVVSGSGSLWNAGASIITVGSGTGSNNTLIAEDGGVITNTGTIRMPYYGQQYIASPGRQNSLIVRSGGKFFSNGGILCGSAIAAIDNQIQVSGAGSTLNMGGGNLHVGGYSITTGSTVRVESSGMITNVISIGVGGNIGLAFTNQSGHALTIASGGKTFSSGVCGIGNTAYSTGMAVTVTGSDSLWHLGNANLTIGIATSTNNALTIDQGGTVDAIGTLTVAGAFNDVNLRGGTLGLANTTYTNGLFAAGDGVQATTLKALGGTLAFPSGLRINTNAALSGIGVINGSGTGVSLLSGASITPGIGAVGTLTVGSNLTWNAGGIYVCAVTNMDLGAGLGWDLVTVATQLVLNGSGLVIKLDSLGGAAAGFDPAGEYSIKIMGFGAQTGFSAANFTVNTNAFPGGTTNWTVATMNNGLYLQYRGGGVSETSSKWNDPNSGNWDVSGNWTPGGQPANDGTAALEFGGGVTPYAATNNLGTFKLNKLILTGAGGAGVTNTIGGSSLIFTNAGAGVDYSGSGSYTVTNTVLLAGGAVFGGVGGGGTLLMAGNIGGGQPLVKEGPWTLALKGANTFADPVVIDNGGGVVRLDANAAFGTNSFVLSNGTLQATAAMTLGNGSLLRQATVTGMGSLWTNSAGLTVGSNATVTVDGGKLAIAGGFTMNNTYGASPCGLLITNGGVVTSTNGFDVGTASSSNTLLITGNGSMYFGPGDVIAGGSWPAMGAGGNRGNTIWIEDGGTYTNARLGISGTNSLVVTNGGRFFATTLTVGGFSQASVIGGPGVSSRMGISSVLNLGGVGAQLVVDGRGVEGSATAIPVGVSVGQAAGQHGNRIRVINKGQFWTTSVTGSSIGNAGNTNNGVEVVQGGYARFSCGPNSGGTGIGRGSQANYNYALVEDTGSVLELANAGNRWEIGFEGSPSATNFGNMLLVRKHGMMTNAAVLSIASFVNVGQKSTNCYNNGMLVSATGRVYSSGACQIGWNSGVTGNFVKVTDSGSYWSLGGQSITIGHANALGLSTNNYLMITQDGTVEKVGYLLVYSNNQVYLNGGTLGLINAGISNGLPMLVGDGLQTASLKAQGGSLNIPAGLVITNYGMLTGTGTVLADTTVHGTLSPGSAVGAITNNGAFVLKPGANTAIELATYTSPGAGWDHLAVTNGALELDGTLSVLLIDGFAPTNTQSFVIMTNLGPLSVSGVFASGTSVPAYTNVGGKSVGTFRVAVGSKGVVLDSFAAYRGNPGAVIYIR